MKCLARKLGQTTIEYALVTICILGALLAIDRYGRRALQGRLRSSFDQIGEQYDPGRTTSNTIATMTRDITTTVHVHEPLTVDGRAGYGGLIVEEINDDTNTRSGFETVEEFGDSIWE